jgi:hypothetical protein
MQNNILHLTQGLSALGSGELHVIRMKITEIIAIMAAIVSGSSLALIQIRRIVNDELSPFGLQSIKDAAKIEIDRLDRLFLVVSGISFLVCIVFAFISYG